MIFNTEYEMSEVFEAFVKTNLENDNIQIFKGFKGLFGIPDFVLIENSENHINYIISIELKLKNWKRALKQAFRYRTFSNESYVILDEFSIKLGLKNLDYFKKFNVGLGSLNTNSEFKLLYYPISSNPFSTKFNSSIEKHLSRSFFTNDTLEISWNNMLINESNIDTISLHSKLTNYNT